MTEEGVDPFAVMRLVDDRRALLEELASAPADKPALVASLDCSRSTVYRAIDQLERHYLVERTGDGYVLTFPGRRIVELYDRYRGQVGAVTSRSGLLSALPADCRLPDELLWQGDLIEGGGVEPYAPQQALCGLFEDASRLRLSYPVLDSSVASALLDRVESDRPTDVLVDRSSLEYLWTAAPSLIRELRSNEALVLAADSLEYGVAYAGSRLAVLLCESRQWTGLLLGESPAGCLWAKRAYRRQRSGATPVSELEIPLENELP
ncbi:MAG: hypothetical protein QXG03_10920 [Halalkalicoccus sp.]